MKRTIIAVILGAAVAVALPAGAKGPEQPRLFIIDDDVGMLRSEVIKTGSYTLPWMPITDPDGGLELIYALREPGIRVLGVTCSMGCSSTEVCVQSVEKILELTGNRDIPVLAGAHSPDELGQPTDAARFIINTVMSYPGQVEILTTAPLTNLATAVMLEPCLPMNWKALHVGTGEFLGELGHYSELGVFARKLGYGDFNINVDPEAASYMLERGGDFILYPNEIMDDAVLTRAHRRELKKEGSELSVWVAKETWPYAPLMSTVQIIMGTGKGMPLHGVMPLAVAIDPDLAEPPRTARVDMGCGKWADCYFVLTDDPSVPARKIYDRLADPEKVEKLTVERCK